VTAEVYISSAVRDAALSMIADARRIAITDGAVVSLSDVNAKLLGEARPSISGPNDGADGARTITIRSVTIDCINGGRGTHIALIADEVVFCRPLAASMSARPGMEFAVPSFDITL
jgi:hypothetical protein